MADILTLTLTYALVWLLLTAAILGLRAVWHSAQSVLPDEPPDYPVIDHEAEPAATYAIYGPGKIHYAARDLQEGPPWPETSTAVGMTPAEFRLTLEESHERNADSPRPADAAGADPAAPGSLGQPGAQRPADAG